MVLHPSFRGQRAVAGFFEKNHLPARHPYGEHPLKGLYANIQAKKKRIAEGSGEKMRKPGTKGAPTDKAFAESRKTAKKK
jgi:hypothetical protein